MFLSFKLFILLCLSLLYNIHGKPGKGKTELPKVIIDTDAGSDDAAAILLALASSKVEVIAITCTYGNTAEINVETNVRKTLGIANRPDIPVYVGAKKPLLASYEAGEYFGKDGMGDIVFDQKTGGKFDRSESAAIAMVSFVKKYPGQVSVITLGPTTNVALAIKIDPDFTKNVKRFYVMGSWIENPTTANEFNFSLDPESNSILLSSVEEEVLIMPKDVPTSQEISKKWRNEELGKKKSKVMEFLNQAEKKVLKRNPEKPWSCSDETTVALMIWPELIISKVRGHMEAVVEGPKRSWVNFNVFTNGQKNLNYNVEVVQEYDVKGFQNKLLSYLD